MKLQLLAGGVLATLLAACGSDPVYYGDSYYPYTYYRSNYYGDRYAYNRYPVYYDDRVASIEVLNGAPIGGIVAGDVVVPPPAPPYRVTLPKPHGTYQTYVMEAPRTLRVGG